MTRVKERQEAIKLRLKGLTYSDIRKHLNIAKSTLSDWLSKYPLTKEQIELLEKNIKKHKELSIEKVRITKRRKRERRWVKIYKEVKKAWIPLRREELELAGIFLYWGEGNKRMNGPLSLNNTDPQVLKFYLYWLKDVLKISKEKIRVNLHLYSDMSKETEMEFWSEELKLPLTQFSKPYIKSSKRSDIDQKGFGHGTCGLTVSNISFKEHVMMTIQAVADYYSKRI
ncbi:hypothetical protein A2773_07230 [Candidatus Gottesmanbacteria bacterium RIFCSPHIGHO2_01_FULL_39_10]|uniref:Uncharacterized protein n=1 Tax=Candidatus Gottesmanbacteria bacterium RIFCSPHIGHO2_01_FULL_39_10 TaxID=1798375 RepID=A0A1F5ZNI6_9BACT|nr:MAG: hypothetical protein A2773_07230 [Candidatus Gottesmanbacteria bacterium RIFCSPHIGHO2_01_FULL_39_10]